MGSLAGVTDWPADTSEPVLELTTGALLREAAADAGTQTALIEAAPPGAPSLAGAERKLHDLCRANLAPHKTPARWFGVTEPPLTGSGKIQKFRLREQIDGGELNELPPR